MKYYVVLKGRQTGIFTSRDECKRQVDGFLWAVYKSFTTQQAAEFAWKAQNFWQKWQSTRDYLRTVMGDEFDIAICTDAACSSNPGPIEYRGVCVSTGDELFFYGPYLGGSVNIAEFLAIVEGMRYLLCHSGLDPKYDCWEYKMLNRVQHDNRKDITRQYILYSDSKIAISRIQKGTINTQILPNSNNKELFTKIREAEQWLLDHPQRSQFVILKKRPTSQRGQIPADFGRK